MADANAKVVEDLRSLQGSLKQAEDSFAQGSDMRGELDLMLAEAQMQLLTDKRKKRNTFLKQLAALAVMGTLVAVGLGAWHAKRSMLLPSEVGAGVVTQKGQLTARKALPKEETMVTVERQRENKEKVAPVIEAGGDEGRAQLADREAMRDLVRSARQKLNE